MSYSYAASSAYLTFGAGIGMGFSFKNMLSGSVGYTYLIGSPILLKAKKDEFTNSYIRRLGHQ